MPSDPRQMISECAGVLAPPERLTVMESAIEHGLNINIPGKGFERYDPTPTYYMRRPMECLTMRRYSSVIFIGPAQSGKTFHLVELFAAYSILSDPMDTKIVEKDRQAARDFVKLKLDRLIQSNPVIRDKLSGLQSDTITDKAFLSGIQLLIGWPTENQLAGRPIGRMIITDYDRVKSDVGGEGSGAGQASQRIKTFGSRGMMVIESSPSKPIKDSLWDPPEGNRHIYPPADGIGGEYNGGTQERMYGKCPHCGEYMLPIDGPEGFSDSGALICTANGCEILQGAQERKFKRSGVWAAWGQEIDHDTGEVFGDLPDIDRASFWMPGAFAAFQNWAGLLSAYRKAKRAYEETGEEAALKNCVNADFSAPFVPVAQRQGKKPYSIWMERSKGTDSGLIAPEWTRLILAQIDIQGNRFECMMVAVGPGFEQRVMTRFPLGKSPHREGDHIRPGEYLEDWDAITSKIIDTDYRVAGSDHRLRPYRVAVDYHGQPGVSANAREWYRRLDPAKRQRVCLMRGDPANRSTGSPVRITYPDVTDRKDNGSRGDVPVYSVNTNELKDQVWAALSREDPGPGFIHFAPMDEKYFRELTAETRNDKGKWEMAGKRRNETFDLLCNCRATWFILKGQKIDWENPPLWAQTMHRNSETVQRIAERSRPKARRNHPDQDWFEERGF